MGRLSAFAFVTLNGFYAGPDGEISWHRHGAEENAYAVESLKSGNTLLFGRVTYEMMASYWPTPEAVQNDPIVAEGMNRAEKIVFSRTLKGVTWQNTRIIRNGMIDEVREMKRHAGKGMTVLGSGRILTQLAEANLIDEYAIMVDPVVLGRGTPLFDGIKKTLNLRLTASRQFKSGVVLLTYEPH